MNYEIEIKDDAKTALRKAPEEIRREIGYRLHLLQQEFSGDVKKLRGSKNEYRLRVGNWRVLFELVGKRIVVYDLGHTERHLPMNATAIKRKIRPANSSALDRQIRNAKMVLRNLRDTLEDLDDRRELARAKKRNAGKAGTDWESVKKEFGFDF